MANDDGSYKGNNSIKEVDVRSDWTPERIAEYKRCYDDPKYFINKYINVVSLDEGVIPFKLHSYQERAVDAIHKNRMTISMWARQSGKCVLSNTKIKIRNSKTLETKELTIQEALKFLSV